MGDINLRQFEIPLNHDLTIRGEYEGNPEKGAVIFSHGFGVQRDSRGMFTELGAALKDTFLVVKFDYTEFNKAENTTTVYSLQTQAQMLAKVIEFVRTELKVTNINLVAHSQGGPVVGLLAPDNIQKIILLAPPTISSYERNLQRFRDRPGSVFNEQGVSKLARSDGSFTLIPADFLNDLKTLEPLKLFTELAQKTQLYFVAALQDEILIGEDHSQVRNIQGINYQELPGDHNFTGAARQTLVQIVKEIINT